MQLYNKLSADEREKILEASNLDRITLSFYKYASIKNPAKFRDDLFIFWDSIDVLGRIYIANEGINAQLSLPKKNLKIFSNHLIKISFLKGVRINIALQHNLKSFLKLKIKVKDKIVADGLNDSSFDVTKKGKHVNAKEFNKLMKDKNSIILDMRNHYESEIGHFKNAVCPDVDSFRDSLNIIERDVLKNKKNKKLLMYCTGGIRCEKASAYFKHKGYQNVYQLEGGIIEYAKQVKKLGLENNFIGKNFVFDNRMAEDVSKQVIANCHQCGTPFDIHTNCANDACHLLFIQCENCKELMDNCCSYECKEIFCKPVKEQKTLTKGKKIKYDIFKKGRTTKVSRIN